jgi:hypothetical protein
MRIRSRILPALLLCAGIASVSAESRRTELELKFIPAPQPPHIEAMLPDFVTDEIMNLIRAGVVLSIRYEFEVYRKNPLSRFFWPEWTFSYFKKLEYSPDANVYIVTVPEGRTKVGGLQDALQRFREVDRIVLPEGRWRSVPAEYRYRGRVKMETIKLYPPLSLFVGLVDVYNFTTRWVEFE